MEVRFYDDWRWDDYMGSQGYITTLPIEDTTYKNSIGFLADVKSLPKEPVIDGV